MSAENIRKRVIKYVLMMALNAVLAVAVVTYTSVKYWWLFQLDINPYKAVYCLIWQTVLFIMMGDKPDKASHILIQIFFVLQIIPISVLFYLKNEDIFFYTTICIGFLICELILLMPGIKDTGVRFGRLSSFIISILLFLLTIYLAAVFLKNGFPTGVALNPFYASRIRLYGGFNTNRFISYLQAHLTKAILPVLISFFYVKRKYIAVACVYFMELIIYLYTGEKFILFSGSMVLLCLVFISYNKNGDYLIETLYTGLIISCMSIKSDLMARLYTLVTFRTLLESANNKFFYYDFFSNHPKEGLAGGTFPRWLMPLKSNYDSDWPGYYSYQIARIYKYHPKENTNTGFIAEGYLRFGLIGIILVFIIFALLLKMVDALQDRCGYLFAIGCSISIVVGFGDAHLVGGLIFGYLMSWIFIIMIFCDTSLKDRDLI